jgi:uroporphyrin-III C-methyltransferase / precorrin-2 dehydrogenase / sirohydrochlorin ferrochelatase
VPLASLRPRTPDALPALAGAAALASAGRVDEPRPAFFAEPEAPADPRGVVHLVGAGPGDADLLTLRAHRLLGEADVIVHDRLVSDAVLAMARPGAARIFAGKARANHRMPQDEINALLVRLARAAQCVVRLKGGDPFIFGRGGEEAEALRAAGVAYTIVPGITAALGCAASAGIPLTHRDAARTVTFATGHSKEGRLDLDFAGLAHIGGTLAVYMGIQTLRPLCDGLLEAGMDPAMPALLVQDGGTDHARVLRACLGTLADRARGWTQRGPTLVLTGEVVGRHAPGFSDGEAAILESARAAALSV